MLFCANGLQLKCSQLNSSRVVKRRISEAKMRPSGSHGPTLLAFVECTEATPPSELRSHLSAALPAYMVPQQVRVRRAALPLTSSGKVDRRALLEEPIAGRGWCFKQTPQVGWLKKSRAHREHVPPRGPGC
eukprot:s876_g18.t1